MKIIFFEVNDYERIELKNFLDNIKEGTEIEFYEKKLSLDNVDKIKDAEIISVFINSEINKEIIDKLPNLKFIATRSTGYDHIDTEYAKIKNIKITNVPSYGAHTVAEFSFALILALSRRVVESYQSLRDGTGFDISSFRGFDLSGKTLGVIGTGKIGKNVIKIAKGFNMNVLANDLYPDLEFANTNDFKYVSFEELLISSDIITLHVPFTKENYHLINKDNIGKIKKGGYIINTARGELIDTEVLIKALVNKDLGGAALDVLEAERYLKDEWEILKDWSMHLENIKLLLEDRMLIDLHKAIVTPHIAFYTKEAELEILKTTTNNIKAFIENKMINILSL